MNTAEEASGLEGLRNSRRGHENEALKNGQGFSGRRVVEREGNVKM